MSEQRVRLIDQLIQRAADELYEGKTPERVAGLLQILAGQEIGVQEARTRIAQKFGRGKFATAVEKCFWTSEEREAAETAAAAAAISETPPKPEMTSDPDTSAERLVTVETSAVATTPSVTPAKPDATAEATSATPGDGAGERRAKSPEVRVAVEGEVDQPPASEAMELAADAGAGDARKSVKVTMPSPEPVATVAAESPATITAVTPMDIDASEERRGESTELPVDAASAPAAAPKNPSDPLPPGLKIPRRPRTIVDVRTREEGQGAATGSSTTAASESSSDRRREKRRHPAAVPRRESRHGTSPDRKSSSSRHSRHSSSDRSCGARSRGHSSSKPSSSRTRERSSGASSKRRRKSASPRSTGGAHERQREGRSTKDAGRTEGTTRDTRTTGPEVPLGRRRQAAQVWNVGQRSSSYRSGGKEDTGVAGATSNTSEDWRGVREAGPSRVRAEASGDQRSVGSRGVHDGDRDVCRTNAGDNSFDRYHHYNGGQRVSTPYGQAGFETGQQEPGNEWRDTSTVGTGASGDSPATAADDVCHGVPCSGGRGARHGHGVFNPRNLTGGGQNHR